MSDDTNDTDERERIYPPNPYPYSLLDHYRPASEAPPSLGGGIRRSPPRHTCTVCGEEEGFHNDWDFIVGDNCAPGLRDALHRAFDEYCAQRKREQS